MRHEFISKDSILNLYNLPVLFTDSYSDNDFDSEWEELRDDLRLRLSVNWAESCFGDADFAISDDRSQMWTQAGGIYSRRALSYAFFDCAEAAIINSKSPEKWAIHFSIELTSEDDNDDTYGQILIRKGVIYFPSDDDFDYKGFIKV